MDGSETREQRECRVLRAQVRRLERSVTLARDDARMATRKEHTAVANLASRRPTSSARGDGWKERARRGSKKPRRGPRTRAPRVSAKRRVENRERANANAREDRRGAGGAARRQGARRGGGDRRRDVARERVTTAGQDQRAEADLAATSRRLNDTERAPASTVTNAEARTRWTPVARERAQGKDARKAREATERISAPTPRWRRVARRRGVHPADRRPRNGLEAWSER